MAKTDEAFKRSDFLHVLINSLPQFSKPILILRCCVLTRIYVLKIEEGMQSEGTGTELG